MCNAPMTIRQINRGSEVTLYDTSRPRTAWLDIDYASTIRVDEIEQL